MNTQKKHPIQFAYAFLGLCIFLIIVLASIRDNTSTPFQIAHQNALSFEEGWTEKLKQPVNLAKLNEVPSAAIGDWTSIYNTLPDSIPESCSLCMLSGYIYLQVYIDGKLVYEPTISESRLYNKSFGHAWSFVPLSQADANKTIEIRYCCSYPDEKAYIRNLMIEREGSYITYHFKNHAIPLITSALLIFVGILFICFSLPITINDRNASELIYLGLLSIAVAVWSVSETRMIQLFFDNSRTMNIVSDLSLTLIAIPTVLYTDKAIQNRITKTGLGVCCLSLLQTVACIILHLAGIREFRSMLFSTHIIMLLGAFYILYRTIDAVIHKKFESSLVYQILRFIGLITFVIGTIIDLFRYYHNVGEERTTFVRIGLLVFVISYGVASTEKIISAIQFAAKSELITKLAYEDGLTGIGNRTAYQEALDAIQEQIKEDPSFQFGLAMLDVNNLKVINDQQGHLTGDQLLKECAAVICQTFEQESDHCYRIGGDEFAAILTGNDIENKLHDRYQELLENVTNHNQSHNFPFEISVACGYSFYQEFDYDDSIINMQDRADIHMYENKRAMKARM